MTIQCKLTDSNSIVSLEPAGRLFITHSFGEELTALAGEVTMLGSGRTCVALLTPMELASRSAAARFGDRDTINIREEMTNIDVFGSFLPLGTNLSNYFF